MSYASRYYCISSLLTCLPFIYFSCLFALDRNSSTICLAVMKVGILVWFPMLKWNECSFSPLSVMLSLGFFSLDSFSFPSIPEVKLVLCSTAACRLSCVCACVLIRFSHVWLFATARTVACWTPLSMEFSRQGYWSALPCPSSGDLADLGVAPASLSTPALADGFFSTSTTWEAPLVSPRTLVLST